MFFVPLSPAEFGVIIIGHSSSQAHPMKCHVLKYSLLNISFGGGKKGEK